MEWDLLLCVKAGRTVFDSSASLQGLTSRFRDGSPSSFDRFFGKGSGSSWYRSNRFLTPDMGGIF